MGLCVIAQDHVTVCKEGFHVFLSSFFIFIYHLYHYSIISILFFSGSSCMLNAHQFTSIIIISIVI